jgi:hypothetical protein
MFGKFINDHNLVKTKYPSNMNDNSNLLLK